MSDNLLSRRLEDFREINVNKSWELRYWKIQLGVTEDELKQAVQAVGSNVADVREWLYACSFWELNSSLYQPGATERTE